MTATKGNGIINTMFDGYQPYKGDMNYRSQGSLIAFESGESITYGLFNAQERGTLFIGPGEQVYGGMVVGQCGKAEDIEVNVCKKKQLTNTRASGSDDALKLTPPKILSLEQALDSLILTSFWRSHRSPSVSVRRFWIQHFVCVQSVQCSRINLSKTIILKTM